MCSPSESGAAPSPYAAPFPGLLRSHFRRGGASGISVFGFLVCPLHPNPVSARHRDSLSVLHRRPLPLQCCLVSVQQRHPVAVKCRGFVPVQTLPRLVPACRQRNAAFPESEPKTGGRRHHPWSLTPFQVLPWMKSRPPLKRIAFPAPVPAECARTAGGPARRPAREYLHRLA